MAKRRATPKRKYTKVRATRTVQRKSATRRRKSGNPFEIDNVRTLI